MRAVLLALTLCGPAWAGDVYLELGVGYDRYIDYGVNPQSVVRLRYEAENRQWWKPDVLEYSHHSSIRNGAPFNHEPEDITDQFSVVWRLKVMGR